MEKLYDTIIASRYKNDILYKNKIDTNKFDKLIMEEEDTKYCMSLTIPIRLCNLDIEMKHNLKMVCQKLSDLSNDSCYIYYPECQLFNKRANLHITVLSIANFEKYNDILKLFYENNESYLHQIRLAINSNGLYPSPIYVELRGLLLTDCAIIIKGYPTWDINSFRDSIRTNLDNTNLLYSGRYKNELCHLTIFRFGKDDLTQYQYENLKKYVYENNNTYFGKYNIMEMHLASAGWTCSKTTTQIHHTFMLRNLC